MSTLFDTLPDRRSTESLKWRKFDQDVLPMWVADMDFLSPEPVIRALRERVDHGVFGYGKELPEIREVVAQRLLDRYGWKVSQDELIFIPGVVTGFNTACQAFKKPGGGVLVQTPVYGPFLKAPENAGMFRQEMELTCNADDYYSIDFDAFESAITEQTQLFVLCNPHNPVGRVFRPDELEKLAEICLRHHVPICSDEIHCDLVFSGHKHTPIASLAPEISQNTITLIAPSKTYNIAGLECSVAIIQNPELRNKFEQARQGLVGWVNFMGMLAGLVAYRDGQPWLDELLEYLEANRDYLVRRVQNDLPGISMKSPEATYLAWLDCRKAGIEGNLSRYFIENARVAMNDGTEFGKAGEGFVRLNFGCPRSMLEEAIDRIQAALVKK